mmetsp:Transcript_40637/g.73283  ORF Transcript_40637/g.73283 Transcript_40637/m.73283 type:complete len:290 (-) Transcript_40637:1404-2273(-)
MGILLSYPIAKFDSAEHALTRASKLGSLGLLGSAPLEVVLGAVRVITAMRASITPGVRNTRFLFALEMLRFINARHAWVVQVVAPVLGWHVASATYPSVSTNPGVPNRAASLASALLKFLMHVVAFSRASSATLLELLELELESRGGLEKCRPSMTSRIASKISLTPVISILLLFPQLKFIMAMQACNRALSLATPMVLSIINLGPGVPLSSNVGGGTATTTGSLEYPWREGEEACWINGPPRATNASIWSNPAAFIKYRSFSSAAVKLRTVSTAYSLPNQLGLVYLAT